MSIVPETAPVPPCRLTPEDVARFSTELDRYLAPIVAVLPRRTQRWWATRYLHGLLGATERKSIEPMALDLGLSARQMQFFISEAAWVTPPLLAQLERQVAYTLGMPDGVAVLDESGTVKQGTHSVGVAHQYCGNVGKTANCQVGVFLAYATERGASLVDARLFVPEVWFDDAHAALRRATGLPDTLTFQTKPQIALTMLRETLAGGRVPIRWVAADALYGSSSAFRDGVDALGLWYVTAVSCDTLVWRRAPAMVIPTYRGKGRKPVIPKQVSPGNQATRVDAIVQRLPPSAWTEMVLREGSKGPIVGEATWLRVTEHRGGQPGPRLWLVIWRSLRDPSELRFYLSNAPETVAGAALLRVIGLRWRIERCFEIGKGELGMDHSEVRSWAGWHHHMALVLVAQQFLVWVQQQAATEAPAVTLPQLRQLLSAVVPKPDRTWADTVRQAKRALDLVRYYQKRNHAAAVSQRKRTVAALEQRRQACAAAPSQKRGAKAQDQRVRSTNFAL